MKGVTIGLRVFLGICVMLVTFGLASPVSADGPEKTVIVRDYTMEIPVGWLCSFPLTMHSYGEIHLLSWYDKDGNLVKQQELWGQANQSLTAYGKTLYLHVNGGGHYTFPSPTEMIVHGTGPVSFGTAPGYGVVIGATGEFKEWYSLIDGEWVLVESTGWHGISIDDTTDFCAYFEG